jgi:hypothetical protein
MVISPALASYQLQRQEQLDFGTPEISEYAGTAAPDCRLTGGTGGVLDLE